MYDTKLQSNLHAQRRSEWNRPRTTGVLVQVQNHQYVRPRGLQNRLQLCQRLHRAHAVNGARLVFVIGSSRERSLRVIRAEGGCVRRCPEHAAWSNDRDLL